MGGGKSEKEGVELTWEKDADVRMPGACAIKHLGEEERRRGGEEERRRGER